MSASKLIYITTTSLDGYIEDEAGAIDWANPEQVFGFITELMRPIGTHLLGRRLYETMTFWDKPVDSYALEQQNFARVWQGAEKVIFSKLERAFDADVIREMKRESEHDIFIGGAEIAGLAIEAGLVDECHLFINPVILGGGKPAFPALRRKLELLETRDFTTGVIYVHYRILPMIKSSAPMEGGHF